MDIGKEITAHLEWIETIVSLLDGQEIAHADLQAITRHDQCELGQWLNSDDSLGFRDLPEYEKLVESHEAFHNLAGDLIAALQMNKEAEAIESQQHFLEMSQKVIDYLHVFQEHGAGGDDENA